MTDYDSYRTMPWTSDHDECEAGCGVVMAEGRYVEGDHGHYCSRRCLYEQEGDSGPSDAWLRQQERRQMGIG